MILLDTDVMIDVLRGHEPARQWLQAMSGQEIGLPGLVAMELLQGCQNTREQKRLESSISQYPLYWAEAELATFNIKHYHAIKELKTLQPYQR